MMKRRAWSLSALVFCVFFIAGLAFSQEAIELQEASNTKPDLKKEKEVKQEEVQVTKDLAALKIKLILSNPIPIFSVKLSPKLRE